MTAGILLWFTVDNIEKSVLLRPKIILYASYTKSIKKIKPTSMCAKYLSTMVNEFHYTHILDHTEILKLTNTIKNLGVITYIDRAFIWKGVAFT